MRDLQFFGIAVSFIICLYALWRFKRGSFNQVNFIISQCLAVALLILSIFPSAGDLIAKPLQMERWNGVLFFSILVLLGLFFYLLSTVNTNNRTISRLVQSLAFRKFHDEYPNFTKADILVVIPAYNEADNICDVLTQIPTEVCGKEVNTLVVVDGGSDKTEDVVRGMGFPVIINPINRGGGAALRAGYQVAIACNASIVVTLDADGQHVPAEMERLIAPIINNEADFVNGSRVLGSFEQESAVRSFGVVLFNWLVTILMAQRITDCSNAYRAIRTTLLKKLLSTRINFIRPRS